MKVTKVGIDLAKNVLQLHGVRGISLYTSAPIR